MMASFSVDRKNVFAYAFLNQRRLSGVREMCVPVALKSAI